MKHILAFGDSNTFGTKHFDLLDRFDLQTRWTGLLAAALGNDFRIIEEGMPGRTTAFDDPIRDYRSGRHYLVPCLSSHRPLDLTIVMLGTNDLQVKYSAAPTDIASGVEVLVNIIQKAEAGPNGGAPEILIIAPPPVGAVYSVEEPSWLGAQKKCLELPKQYERIAARYRCHFVNSQEVLTIDDLGEDGLHLAASGHAKLGKHVAGKVLEILTERTVTAV